MMKSTYVTLEELKAQCRCDDGDYADAILQQKLEDAEAWVIRKTRRTPEELLAMGSGTFPGPLRQAVLMLAAHWYASPEGVGNTQEIPYGISATVKPYIRLV